MGFELSALGEKIFLDRYALKDGKKETLKTGDTVVAVQNESTGQREIGIITDLNKEISFAKIELKTGEEIWRSLEHIDKPLETTVEQMMARVAKGAASVERDSEKWEKEFKELLDDWKFIPGGRILTACGTDQNLTFYNCYVIPSPEDTRGGIFETLKNMAEIMSRGGGVGINVSTLRPKHAYVKGVNGRSSGSVSWGGLYSFVTGLIEQGGSRRGALMLILNIWHPDVLDFIDSKREAGKIVNANISVGITDDFMAAVENNEDWSLRFPDTTDERYAESWKGNLKDWEEAGGKVIVHKTMKAREIWDKIINSAWASAEPGVWFLDRSNEMSNSRYYEGGELVCTNPCVTGDTRVYTEEGVKTVKSLFDDEEFVSCVQDSRLSRNKTAQGGLFFVSGIKPVFKLKTKQGYEVRLTKDHRVNTERGWVEAGCLVSGDKVRVLNREGKFGDKGSADLGKVLGWFVGDGYLFDGRAELDFYGDKAELAESFSSYVNNLIQDSYINVSRIEGRNLSYLRSVGLYKLCKEYGLVNNKLQVPEIVFEGTRETQIGFLSALFSADGHLEFSRNGSRAIVLTSISRELLQQTQQLLLNLGIFSSIFSGRKGTGKGTSVLPNGKGGYKEYSTKEVFDLRITKDSLVRFNSEIKLLLVKHRSKLDEIVDSYSKGPYTHSFLADFESLEEDGLEEVYDISVPETNAFIANGIVVHNCGEQPLSPWSVCNLGHINLSKFVKDKEVLWKDLDKSVATAIRFLDNMIDKTPYFFEANKEQQLKERRVGLGTMGLAEMLIKLEIKYGSPESIEFIEKLYQRIAEAAYFESAYLSSLKGSFPAFDYAGLETSGFFSKMHHNVKYEVKCKGLRNVTLLTQAPTGTVGTMVGTSTGIEPFYAWTYFRKGRLGLHEEKVKVLEEWEKANPGVERPDYFVSAMELTPEQHVRVQAACQKWVDSAISKTCNCPSDYTVEQTKELYELMYKLGCKGGTIYRDKSRDEQVLSLKEEPTYEKDDGPIASESIATINKVIEASSIKVGEVLSSLEDMANKAIIEVTPEPKVRPRPKKCYGVTVCKTTPAGTAHITMNDDEGGKPFEVFVEIGKGGSDLKAMAEAIGRLTSLVLRISSPLTPRERVQEVVNQLSGIGGQRSVGFGKSRVRSLPDALSQALEEQYIFDDSWELETPVEEDAPTKEKVIKAPQADLCHGCGNYSLVRIEGCHKCDLCGHSEC